MRASSRRSHHSSRVGARREAPAHGEAFGLERGERRGDVASASSPSGAASAPRVTGPSPSSRPRRISTSASSRDQRRSACGAGAAIGGSSCASGHSALELRQPLGGDPEVCAAAAADARRAVRSRASCVEPLAPSRLAAAASSSVRKPSQTSASCSSSAFAGVGPGLARARARSPRDRAGRGRRRPPGRASGGSSPPACGAPRAAHRRDRRRAAPTAPRARAATARSDRARRPRPRRPRCRVSSRSSPSMSIASFRQSAIVWRTSGWSGISRSPTRFSAQATWSGKTAAIRSSASMRASCGGTFLPPRKRGSASAIAGDPAPARREHRRVEQRLDQHVAHASPNAGSARRRPARSCAPWSATARCCPRSPPPAARN